MKFKVGDRVEIINQSSAHKNMQGTVDKVNPYQWCSDEHYRIIIDKDLYEFYATSLELTKQLITESLYN